MFSRAAKSVVKSVGSRRTCIGEKNFEIALIGGAREISQTLSQLLKNNVKLNTFALYDVAAVNRPLPFYNFYEQQFNSISSEMPTMRKKSCLEEGNRSNAVINSMRQTDNNNHEGNNGRNQTEKLVEALYRLPIAEEAPALNSPLIPIEELISKAGNACSRMCLYVLGETSSSNMKIWQRNYDTVPICKWFFDLMYPSSQEYDLKFIPEAKIAKIDRSIKKRTKKIEYLSYSTFATYVAKKNNQLLLTFLLNHGEKPARRLMKKFRNVSILPNIEAHCKGAEKSTDWSIPEILLNTKLKLLHEFYARIIFPLSSLNFINYKRENNREVDSFNHDSETMTDDTLNVVEQENWIRRTCSKIKSILPDLQAKIRFHSTTHSDSYCSENIFVVNQVPFFDIISNNAILFAKDYKADKQKVGIRRKIQEFCMQRKRTLKKNIENNDFCNKKEESCEEREIEHKCQNREKRKIKCTGKKQNVLSYKGRNNSCNKKYSRNWRKSCEPKAEIQEDPCKPKKDIPRIEKDPCHEQPRERKEEIQEDLCKKKKDDPCKIKEDPCKTKEDPCKTKEDPCKTKEDFYKIKEDPCKTKEDPCRISNIFEQEQTYYELHDISPCRKKNDIKKKEEIKKPECRPVKKLECSDNTKEKDS
ncbi:hypothetical protein ALC53_13389 [Atta colombica]|uniref:Uncharacterized protein n=1 Tax=Atta colombica TaxID=520822 RepID=A0A195AWD5_9HYME|nr:hypothetical protein ALC53_13389 [Atta colombica]